MRCFSLTDKFVTSSSGSIGSLNLLESSKIFALACLLGKDSEKIDCLPMIIFSNTVKFSARVKC